MRVILDKGCREIDAPSGRRLAAKDGVFDMEPGDAKAVARLGGAVCSLAGTARRHVGYTCGTCGFRTYFKVCSKCKEETGIKE